MMPNEHIKEVFVIYVISNIVFNVAVLVALLVLFRRVRCLEQKRNLR